MDYSESAIRTRHFFATYKPVRDDQPATKEETELYGKNSKRLLIYAACLNSAMIDLEIELRKAGILRHAVKRNFGRVSVLVQKISTALYKGVAERISKDFCYVYNSCMESSVSKMCDSLKIKQPEKSYNIVISLIRLTLKSNNSIGRFKQQYITALEKAIPLLECGLKDYKLDVVIEQSVDEMSLP